MKMRKNRQGQSILEYTMLIIIVMGVLLTMSNYIKRGFQGRFRESTDDLGDQYDPRVTDASILHTIVSNTLSKIKVYNATNLEGFYTQRDDLTNSTERKQGSYTVTSY